MTKPIADCPCSEVQPAAPIPGNPKRGVWDKRHGTDPKVVVELLGNIIMLIQFIQVGYLAIDVLKGITAGTNRVHLANSAGPNPFAELSNRAARMALITQLSHHVIFSRRR